LWNGDYRYGNRHASIYNEVLIHKVFSSGKETVAMTDRRAVLHTEMEGREVI
jgi:hypothetical protein